jgi:hypothetical protein
MKNSQMFLSHLSFEVNKIKNLAEWELFRVSALLWAQLEAVDRILFSGAKLKWGKLYGEVSRPRHIWTSYVPFVRNILRHAWDSLCAFRICIEANIDFQKKKKKKKSKSIFFKEFLTFARTSPHQWWGGWQLTQERVCPSSSSGPPHCEWTNQQPQSLVLRLMMRPCLKNLVSKKEEVGYWEVPFRENRLRMLTMLHLTDFQSFCPMAWRPQSPSHPQSLNFLPILFKVLLWSSKNTKESRFFWRFQEYPN